EKDFYLVGMKSYGRAPTFLLATGYEQVRSVVAAIAGDQASATSVQLELPETGVCNTDLGGSCDAPETEPASGCGASSGAHTPSEQESGCCAAPQLVSLGVPTGTVHGRSSDPDY
ncbi:flavoprotein, partial [Arthrobacter tecti]